MMRLSGWVRLWMLLSVIYLGVVTAISTMMLPSENSVTSADVLRYLSTPTLLKMKVAAKSDEWTEEKRGHRSIPVPIRLSQTERSAFLAEYETAFASALRDKRQAHALIALLWWVAPCTILALLGYGIAWVRRGFREPNAPYPAHKVRSISEHQDLYHANKRLAQTLDT